MTQGRAGIKYVPTSYPLRYRRLVYIYINLNTSLGMQVGIMDIDDDTRMFKLGEYMWRYIYICAWNLKRK